MSVFTAYSPWGSAEEVGTQLLHTPDDIPLLIEKSHHTATSRATGGLHARISALQQFLVLYSEQKTSIATLMSKEIGKPITQALADIDYDIGYITYYLEHAAVFLQPEIVYEDETSTHTIHREPRGIGVSIAPRNYPTSQFIWEVVPPLVAGNTIIFKPAQAALITGAYICSLLSSCLPEGVLQGFYGPGATAEQLLAAPIDFVVFTGSTATGEKINAAAGLKKTFLELGGSAPGIILPDATIDTAMMETISRFRRRHGGQICDGLKRLFVHRSRYDELIKTLSSYLADKKIGNPLDPDTDLGCLVSQSQKDLVHTQLLDATSKGAQLLEFGLYDNTPGPFMKHTLVVNPTLDMRVMHEEVFGPMLPVMIYDELNEAIHRANSTPYGLGGYVWGEDRALVDTVCARLKTGNINVNNTNYVIPQVPFGGAKWASGNCREHGAAGLREYCEVKVISTPK